MVRFMSICLIVFAAASGILAIPGGGGGTVIRKPHRKPYNPTAEQSCVFNYDVWFDKFTLIGRGWDTNETEIKQVLNDACMVTKWHYHESWEKGRFLFSVNFRVPLGCKNRIQIYLNQLIGVNTMDKNAPERDGVQCLQQNC